jgi:hypothetical protein
MGAVHHEKMSVPPAGQSGLLLTVEIKNKHNLS